MDEHAQALITFGAALASELGGSGSYDHEHRYWYEITKIPGAPGVVLACDARMGGQRKPGRVEVRSVLPNHAGRSYEVKRPVIGVSLTRSAASVAADVKRRLLPDAIKAHAAAVSQIEQYVASEYAERTACAVLGIKPNHGGSCGGRYLDIRETASAFVDVQSGGSVRIDVRSCPVGLALKIVALLEAAAAEAERKAA